MKIWALYGLVLIISGCTSSTIPMSFRPEGFTTEEVQLIKNAASEWSTDSNGRYAVMVDESCSEGCSVIRKVLVIDGNQEATASCLAHVDHMGITTHMACDQVGSDDVETYEIQILYDYNAEHQSLHEFGHVFGKHHDPEAGNVMYAYVEGQPEELTARDLQ